nr:putative epimerase [Vibrio metoecus]
MSILLTGRSGFIGKYLANYADVSRVVVRNGSNLLNESVYCIDSFNDMTDWSGAFDGITSVIHLAALAHSNNYTFNDYQEVNVKGTLNLARQCVLYGVKRFVFVSSIGVNGISTDEIPFSAESIENPHSDYARSKYEAELGLKNIASETGLEIVIVRPTLVYGPDAPGNFGLLTKLITILPFLPFGRSCNRRNFIAVQNLADLLVTCATHPNANGHIFLASDGETVSIKEFTNAIAYGLGKRVIQLPIPVSLISFLGYLIKKSDMVEQLFGNLEVDSTNINKILGWVPPLTMTQAMHSLRRSGE